MGPEKSLTPISAFSVYKNLQNQQKSQSKKKKRNKRKAPAQEVKQIKSRKQLKNEAKPNEDEIPQLVEIETPLMHESVSSVSDRNKVKKVQVIDDPTLEGTQLFKWLISPLNPEVFFNKFWEDDVLHIKRNKPKYYSHILDSQSIDKILRDNSLFFTRNVDVVSYQNGVKESFNQEGRAIPSVLWDYYNNGCSIRILNPQTYNQKVHLLISTLQEFFGCMVGTNVYLTPPGSQGFAPHFDDIEAFIVQLEGRKYWKLYQPKDSDVLARDSSKNFDKSDLGEPFMEVTLEAGDILYFPRGTIHEGRTDSEAHSLHITISVYQHTAYIDLLEIMLPRALNQAAEKNIAFRKGLPLNYLKNLGAVHRKSAVRKLVKDQVKTLMENVQDYLDLDSAADELGRRFVRDSMPPVLSSSEARRSSKFDGPFLMKGKVLNSVELNLDTKVRLLRYYCIRLVEDGTSNPKLYYSTENSMIYHGEEEQWLELEPQMVSVIKILQSSYPNYLVIEKLPMEDEIVKMQLISDLWEKGLLVTEEPLPTFDVEEDSSESD